MMMTFVQSGRRGLLSASRWSNGSIHHRQLSSFTFAGARKLDDIIKKEMLADKSASEISDLWTAYHESKVRRASLCVVGLSLSLYMYIGAFICATTESMTASSQ